MYSTKCKMYVKLYEQLSFFIFQISRRIMRNCIHLNEKFYRADKPVLLTIAVDKNGSFNVSFMKKNNDGFYVILMIIICCKSERLCTVIHHGCLFHKN